MVDAKVAISEVCDAELGVAFAIGFDVGTYVTLASRVSGIQIEWRHGVCQEKRIGDLQSGRRYPKDIIAQNLYISAIRIIAVSYDDVSNNVTVTLL